MSIIERVAELLGPIERPKSKSSAPGEERPISEQDAIERAVSASNFPSEFAEPKERAAQPEAIARRPQASSASSRIFKVDQDQLRRQGLIAPDGERNAITESFRRIKRQILANLAVPPKVGAPSNLVMVTSALPGEGKTFCTVNLAISIALEMDRTVLLVDADVAKPSVPQALGLKAEQGLMDMLLDRQIELSEVLCKTNLDKLTLLPAGTAHPHATELLASEAMRVLLQEMADRYQDRIVIFDSPPLLAASEAGVLASRMGQIVMVVEAGKTSEAVLKDALGRIDSSNVAGLLLNKGQGPGLYYGGYGYGAR